jgi:SulP family sulfate permease
MNERLQKLSKFVPAFDWVRHYRRADLPGDLIAGLVLGVMAVPQSMAYALLANLPPQVGLYSAIVPLFFYALFGSSRYLSIGPVALISLLTGGLIAPLASPGSPEAVQIALIAAFVIGLIRLLMGLLRLGFVVNFLSHPVLSGFTSSAAIVIAVSQFKYFMGVSLPRSDTTLGELWNIFQQLRYINWTALLMGIGATFIVIYFQKKLRNIAMNWGMSEFWATQLARSGGLVVVILSILLTWLLRLDMTVGLRTVGAVPSGPPPFTIPRLNFAELRTLLPHLLVMVLISYVESISIAKSLASKSNQQIDSSQELIAMGIANMVAAFSGGAPVSGSFSRTAVNFTSGASTQLSGVINALVVLLVGMVLTSLFYYLPETILAATIFSAVINLPNFDPLRRAWRYSRADTLAYLVTFCAVIGLGVQDGLFLGVGLALVMHLARTSRPHVAVLGRLGESENYRNLNRYEATTCPHVIAIRIDESLYFATAQFLNDTLLRLANENPKTKFLILDASAINYIDMSGLIALELVDLELRKKGMVLHFAGIKGPVMDKLRKIGFVSEIGYARFHMSLHDAMVKLDCSS